MKNLLFLFLFLPFLGLSQPEFSFDLYIEDTLGNRDTVTIGYDPQATDGIDELFGEENIIAQPWGDNFEVRITDKMPSLLYGTPQYETFRTKKQIIDNQCQQNWIPWNLIYIDIKNVTFPFSISWDNELFQNECTVGSMIQNIESNNWFDLGWFGGALSNVQNPLIFDSLSVNHGLELKYLDLDNNPVYSFWFLFSDSTNLTLNTPFFGEILPKISPNPVNSNSNLHISKGEKYYLFNVHGNLLENGIIENNTLNLKNRSSGVYFLQIENKGTLLTIKLIVL